MSREPQTPPKSIHTRSNFPAFNTPVTDRKVRHVPYPEASSASTGGGLITEPVTPEITPRKRRGSRVSKDLIRTPPSTAKRDHHNIHHSNSFLMAPLPSTIGSGRKARLRLESLAQSLLEDQPRSTGFGLGIKSPDLKPDLNLHVANEHTEVHSEVPVPTTPTNKIIQPMENTRIFHEDDEVNEIEISKIRNEINPFIQKSPQLVNPFQTTNRPTRVDYSKNMEVYNSRTGKYTVSDLSESERKIKPKKLDFSAAQEVEEVPDEEDYRGKKFVMKNLNGFMVDMQPKNSLGFEIFKDENV
ncbi:hypothetical protein CAAN1_24S00364 [[Candida] anglica]|uniref:Uncharacterized protein n=1 Tax=[Candida] anglica TaxID=148631 RepID=A0ABP0EFH3_9ASCO